MKPWARRWAQRVTAACFAIGLWWSLVEAFTQPSHVEPYVNSALSGAAPGEPKSAPRYRLLLIGDAGHALPGDALFVQVAELAKQAPDKTLIAFLGDNIYPAGLPEEGAPQRDVAEAHLRAQLEPLTSTGAEILFVPGNHDWDNAGPDGLSAVRREQAFVEQAAVEQGGQTGFAPKQGEPGPECLDRPGLRLAVLDTQWWLHRHERPADTEAAVLERLEACLRGGKRRHVVVLGHHPLFSHGPHGGFMLAREHLYPLQRADRGWLPLPIIGSLYPLIRSLGVNAQDLSNADNRNMVTSLRGAMQASRPLLYAAGHEHSLQLELPLQGPLLHVVSGAGSAPTPVHHGPRTEFSLSALGLWEVELWPDRARLRAHQLRNGELSQVYSRWARSQ